MSLLDFVTAKYIRDQQEAKASKDAEYWANHILDRILRLSRESCSTQDTQSFKYSLKINRLAVDKCMELLQKNGFVCELTQTESDGTSTFTVSWAESDRKNKTTPKKSWKPAVQSKIQKRKHE